MLNSQTAMLMGAIIAAGLEHRVRVVDTRDITIDESTPIRPRRRLAAPADPKKAEIAAWNAAVDSRKRAKKGGVSNGST